MQKKLLRYCLATVAILFAFLNGKAQVFTGTGGTIPGTSTTQTCFTRNVTGVGIINAANGLASVCINITHPNVDELEIVLVAPDGTVVPLSIQNGGSGNNYTNTCFTATATNPIKFGTAPFNGTFLPEGHLGAVNNGQNANGNWRLCIQDRRTAGNNGTLNSWTLTFNNTPAPAPPTLPACANTLPSTSSCSTAALVCDFNGQCGSTSGSTVQDWPGSGLDGCFGLQNNSFIRFIAAATTASFSVWVPTTSQASYNQGGIQMLFFSGSCNSGAVTTHGCYPHILPYSGSGQPLITVVSASGLTPGNTYYLMIDGFNNDNCTFTIAANTGVSILNINPAAPDICTGQSVNLTASGGNGVYNWSPATNLSATTGTTVTANPVGTTTYTVTSTTPTGCPLTKDVTVTVNPLPATPVATINNPTCTNPTGTITVTAPTGAGLQYSLNGGPYQTSPVFTGLTPNTYTITVQNAAGCISPVTTTSVNAAPTTPAAPTATITQPTCTTPTGTITVTAPTGAGLQYSIGGAYQSSPVFPGLTPGNYNITVQNAASCASTTTGFTVNAAPIPPAAPVFTVTQITCTTTSGTLTITAPLGAGLQYSIGGAYQSSPVFPGLTPGNYTIKVQNAAGCTSATTPFTINNPPAIPAQPVVSVVHPTCGATTGTITVTSPVGPQYEYRIILGPPAAQASPVFNNVAPGTYTIVVNVAGSPDCNNSTVVTVNAPTAALPAPTATVTQPTCSTPTGTITVTAPTGAGLQYSINGGPYQSSPIFAGLNSGVYVITAQNAASCVSAPSSSFTVNTASTLPAPTGLVTMQSSCAFQFGRFVFSSPTGSQYEYSINGTSYQSSVVFDNIPPGNYNATVRDVNTGCVSAVFPFTINPIPTAPTPPTVTVVQPNCGTPGTITVTSPLGSNFEYSLNNGPFQASPLFTGLTGSPATADIRVRNVSDNCASAATSVPINASPAPQPFAFSKQNCSSSSNPSQGSITFNSPTGLNFEYSIDGGNTFQSSPFFDNLPWTTYTLTYRVISTGCIAPTQTVTLQGIPGPVTHIVTQPSSCGAGGTITVTAPLGSQYGYRLIQTTGPGLPWQPSPVFTNVPPGDYSILVGMYSDQCLRVGNATITINAAGTQQGPLNITTVHPNCGETAGSIIITPPAGANLEFSINGTNYQASTTFNNVAPGNYNITVRNTATGCVSAATGTTVNPPPTLPGLPSGSVTTQPDCENDGGTITITAPVGSNYQYSVNGGTQYQSSPVFTNLAPNTYNVIVQNTVSGCLSQPLVLTVNNGPVRPAQPTLNTVQPACGQTLGSITITAPLGAGFQFSLDGNVYQTSPVFNNLPEGIYLARVKDATGCVSHITTAIILVAGTIPPAPVVTMLHPNCARPAGSIIVTSPVGTGLEYNLNGSAFQQSNVFDVIPSGTYDVRVRTASGCISAATRAVLNPPQAQPTKPVVFQTQPSCPTRVGEIRVDAPVGPDIEYSLNGGAYQASNIFTGLAGGNYVVTARFTGTNCISPSTLTQIFTLTPEQCLQPVNGDIYFPTAFTPNGDGLNDGFGPGPRSSLAAVTQYNLQVYNRYGEMIFSTNDPLQQWDGRYKGQMLGNNSYTFVARYRFNGRPPVVQKGTFILIR